MGTWISHLRIAENLLAQIPNLDEVAFTFGNLAPDSGVPNADWTQFDPPKSVTHFIPDSGNEARIEDLRFYREHLVDVTSRDDRARYSFLLGYFFHLICDKLWDVRIAATTKQSFAQLFAERGMNDAVELIKGDWYGVDHRYVRDNPRALFWRVFMPAPNPPNPLPFVPTAALHQQFDYIRNYYSNSDSRRVLDRPFPYLNDATMARFVTDATRALAQIHAHLAQYSAPRDAPSALALLSAAEIAPYAPPLGDVVE